VTTGPDGELVAALRRSVLFAELPAEDVAGLTAASHGVEVAQGDVLMAEGSPPDAMYVVLSGELEVTRRAAGPEVLLNVCGPGDLVGELGVANGRPRSATVRARTPARVQRIGVEVLDHLLAHPATARALLTATTRRLDREAALLRQQERMAALGALSAGLLHELNNPAAAVQRGAARLRAVLSEDEVVRGPLDALVGERPVPEDPLDRSDAEAAVSDALRSGGLEPAWDTAAVLVRLGIAPASLTRVLAELAEGQRAGAVRRLVRAAEIRSLLDEVTTGADYLSRIVSGVRPLAYSADQSLTEIDLHAALDQALVLLRHKTPPGVRVVTDFDPAVQGVEGWPADLAMVWTNLLDNALTAVGPEGTVTLRTRSQADDVVVDIENTGPTVPQEVIDRAFDAFFTTKPVGEGTGLGLATSLAVVTQRHKGRLTLTSADGLTQARVVLPRRR
jgi:signal transduction histidine kinase